MSNALLSRRLFLADLGRGAFAVAVLGGAVATLEACTGPGPTVTPAATHVRTGSPQPTASPSAPAGSVAPGGSGAPAGSASSGGPSAPGGVAWTRVNLGFVSAYLLVRDGEGAIVDTGVAGSAKAIEAAMTAVGLAWSDIGNVILTHKHPDHAGSIDAVLAAAPEAMGWIGAGDLAAVTVARPMTAVADGDEVFGLKIVTTPGHTAGHIAVLDDIGGVLVAGDALSTTAGTLAGSNPQFTEDEAAAQATIVKLGKLTFETLLVGHGAPILTGASAQVAALGGG